MKDAGHLDHTILTAAIEKEMPGLLHLGAATRSGPAEFQVVGARAFDHNFRPLPRSWPLVISADIKQCLQDEGFISERGLSGTLALGFKVGGNLFANFSE